MKQSLSFGVSIGNGLAIWVRTLRNIIAGRRVSFWVEGRPKPASEQEMPFAMFYLVTQDYHKVMKIPVERGRSFTERDDERAPGVAIIDGSFARKYFTNEDPIGRRLNLGFLEMQPEIVGVVGHVEHWLAVQPAAISRRRPLVTS